MNFLRFCLLCAFMLGWKKCLRLDLLSGAKIIFLQKQYPSTKNLIQTPKGTKGAIHCKDLSPKRNYAAYILFTGTHFSPFLRITQWIWDSSSGHVNSIYSMDIWRKKSQTREDGWREIKLGEFNTGVKQDRVVHFVICDIYSISIENDPNFVGIEVRPVC